jgi:magnesium-transporting ATPase (P-type)
MEDPQNKEVTKKVVDMVLADDILSSIVAAVTKGRSILQQHEGFNLVHNILKYW